MVHSMDANSLLLRASPRSIPSLAAVIFIGGIASYATHATSVPLLPLSILSYAPSGSTALTSSS